MAEPKSILIHYLIIYTNKPDLRMRPIIYTMKKRLEQKSSITEKQFLSVIKFIERELPFIGWSRDEIFDFFTPVIERSKDPYFDYPESEFRTLDKFFTESV